MVILHIAQLMPLPQTGFRFLLPAYPGSNGKRAVEHVYG